MILIFLHSFLPVAEYASWCNFSRVEIAIGCRLRRRKKNNNHTFRLYVCMCIERFVCRHQLNRFHNAVQLSRGESREFKQGAYYIHINHLFEFNCGKLFNSFFINFTFHFLCSFVHRRRRPPIKTTIESQFSTLY